MCTACCGGNIMMVEKGNHVKVNYIGTFADGSVFDKSAENTPLEFTVGGGEVLPHFEKEIVGMKLNEKKKFTLEAKNAYGEWNEKLIREIPRAALNEAFEPEKGILIKLQDKQGQSLTGKIVELSEKTISIDFNHPLAGKDLTFGIEVVGIES